MSENTSLIGDHALSLDMIAALVPAHYRMFRGSVGNVRELEIQSDGNPAWHIVFSDFTGDEEQVAEIKEDFIMDELVKNRLSESVLIGIIIGNNSWDGLHEILSRIPIDMPILIDNFHGQYVPLSTFMAQQWGSR
jgi:hypothetical protein